MFDTAVGDPLGMHARKKTHKYTVIMRGGTGTKGQIVKFDLTASDTDVAKTLIYGDEDHPLANVLAAGASDSEFALLGVLQSDVADNARVEVVTRGETEVQTDGTLTIGEPCGVGASGRAVSATTNDKIVCIPAEDADGSAGDLFLAYFNGIEGFGHKSS